MAAQEGNAEKYAETHGIGDAEFGSVGIAGMQQSEKYADGEHGGESPEAFQKHLEPETVEKQFFTDRATKQEGGNEKNCAPVRSRIARAFQMGEMQSERHDQHNQSRAYSAHQTEERVISSSLVPWQTDAGQFTVPKNAERKNICEDGSGQASNCYADQVATSPTENRAGEIDSNQIEK